MLAPTADWMGPPQGPHKWLYPVREPPPAAWGHGAAAPKMVSGLRGAEIFGSLSGSQQRNFWGCMLAGENFNAYDL